jgi:hypothetical protein
MPMLFGILVLPDKHGRISSSIVSFEIVLATAERPINGRIR